MLSAATTRAVGVDTDATGRVVAALRAGGRAVRSNGRDRWRAQCPAHDGNDLNLSIAKGDQGVLVKCWSHDCTEGDIAAALGMTVSDLFDTGGRARYDYGSGYVIERRRTATGKTVRPITSGVTPTVRPLWQPPGSAALADSDLVTVCEGEKTADALVRLGVTCVATWAGGARSVGKTDYAPLTGKHVMICPDNDAPGQEALDELRRILAPIAASIRVLRAPAPHNDAADVWLAGGTLDDLTKDTAPAAAPLYVDAAAVLDGHHQAPQTAAGGRRSDGLPLLYPDAVNVLIGAPEAGKTLAAIAMAADELFAGGRVLWLDLDHNGGAAILHRFRQYGVPRDTLTDPTRYRLASPDHPDDIDRIIADTREWAPTLVGVDSIGELLPMFGANSNDADDYTRVHRHVLTAFAATAAVLAIDHEAKGVESRNYGAGGTMAKKRAVDGAMLRVTPTRQFAPGVGGEAQLSIVKDRHGSLRANAQRYGAGEPIITGFILTPLEDDGLGYRFPAPAPAPVFTSFTDDVDELMKLTPPPSSVKDVKARMRWRSERAADALRKYRARTAESVPQSVPHPIFEDSDGSGERP